MGNGSILKAALFAANKHSNQRRKDREASPYINHPLQVANIIFEIGGVDDPEILTSALLHDTLEDTSTTPEEIEKLFGTRVRKIVEEVTDDKSLPYNERKRRQILHASELSVGATLIKLADKISNVLDVTISPPRFWTNSRRREYLDWAEEVVNNLTKCNEHLENYFRKVLRQGREEILN